MSDDDQDEVTIVKRGKTLHYGSLQEQEMLRDASGQSAIDIGIAAGNINISKGRAFITSYVESRDISKGSTCTTETLA